MATSNAATYIQPIAYCIRACLSLLKRALLDLYAFLMRWELGVVSTAPATRLACSGNISTKGKELAVTIAVKLLAITMVTETEHGNQQLQLLLIA